MPSTRIIPALLLVISLAGCSGKQSPVAAAPAAVTTAPARTAPQASQATLMKAVFGKEYRPATKDALAQLPLYEDRKQLRLYVVVPLASKTLDSGDTVLVAQADYATENAKENYVGFEDIGLINVFTLRQVAGEWKVLRRNENLVYRGDNNRPGSVLFTMLGKGKPGLAIVNGGASEFGCIRETILLYDLDENPLRDLTEAIPSKSIHERGCEDGVDGYWSINSKWHFAPPKKAAAYDDLVIVFSGNRTSPSVNKEGQAIAVVDTAVNATARYAYDGKKYRLISGENPTVEF